MWSPLVYGDEPRAADEAVRQPVVNGGFGPGGHGHGAGIPLEIRRLPGRVEAYHAYSDHERAASLLGVQPTIDLPSGIRRMRAWVREVGARKSHPFGHIEVTVNLPPSWAAFTGSR
jgi:hypothetical protein